MPPFWILFSGMENCSIAFAEWFTLFCWMVICFATVIPLSKVTNLVDKEFFFRSGV